MSGGAEMKTKDLIELLERKRLGHLKGTEQTSIYMLKTVKERV